MLIALLFAVIGVSTPSPTRVGMESQLTQGPERARGMVRITRHPFLWGVAGDRRGKDQLAPALREIGCGDRSLR